VSPDPFFARAKTNQKTIGGADGFGAAIADRFNQEGSKVIILDLNRVKGEQKQQANPNLHFLCGDVTRPEKWEQAIAFAQTTFGHIDLVINNAGENIRQIQNGYTY
jgi:NAD(P)-dependent dehydrogenase (short-subunit alcohol dehydrogenase family)